MAKTDNLRVIDPLLTNVARGYRNEEFIGENIFPTVQVDKEAGKIPTFGKEHFRIYNTYRALRAQSNEMEGGYLDTIPFKTEEHDLIQSLDYREAEEAMQALETKAVNDVMTAINLKKEWNQAKLIQDLNTYPTDNKVTLTDNYFNEDNIEVVKIITDYTEQLSSIIGVKPNILVIGAGVYRSIRFQKNIASYLGISINGSELSNIQINEQKLAELFEVDKVLIGRGKYIESPEAPFTNIWGNNIFMAYIAPPSGIDRTPYDPCFGYTLQKKGNPFSDRWTESNGKIIKVRTTDNYDIKIVGAESGFLINNPIDPLIYRG